MAKQTFVADAILTAAQMNALQGNDFNQTVSAKTASYVLVASDVGTKITMSSASATTITVNTSLFAAGDNLTILNVGAGVCTVTAGTATVSTTGTLALVQYASGTLYFTSAGVSVFQADGVTATSGLTLISATTIGTTVSSVTVSSAFSSTYDNYRIIVSAGAASASGNTMNMTLGATATGYYQAQNFLTWAGAASAGNQANGATWQSVFLTTTNSHAGQMDLLSPNLAKVTVFNSMASWAKTDGLFGNYGGFLDNSTQYTAFTLTPSAGTLTGGTIRVYGYQNS